MQIKASLHKKGRFFYSNGRHAFHSRVTCRVKGRGHATNCKKFRRRRNFFRTGIKTQAHVLRFYETTRRSAGGFCFMPRRARFGAGRRANWAAKQNPALRTESGGAAFYSSCKSFDQPSLSNAKNSRLISMATMAASVMPDRATLPSDSVTPDRPTTKTTEVRTMLRFLL